MSTDNLTVFIRGAGELASGIAHMLSKCHFKVCLAELPQPLVVRREVSFCEAVYENEKEVEGVIARLICSYDEVVQTWREGKLPLLVDPEAKIKDVLKPDVMIDATMSKRNLDTKITDAPLVIGVGIGFQAGKDAHAVIETNRGHNLGRIIVHGEAEPDTGIPAEVAGFSGERVLHAKVAGTFLNNKKIGDYVKAGDIVASINGIPIRVQIDGIIRGLLRDGTRVCQGTKLGDVDSRGVKEYCYTISEKSRAIAGGVLATIMKRFNK